MISAAIARQNLLIVDDDPAQLQTLRDILQDDGFNVCDCSTVEDALRQCQSLSFAIAILDLRLQGQNGIELLQKVRQSQPGIRTIIHTGYGSFDSAMDAVNLGAFAYVEKRGNPAELLSQVHRAAEDRLNEALSQSERRYRELLDDVDAIVWERELPSWQFTFVSQHAESILGYPVEQWLESPDFWVNHLHDEDRQRCINLCTEHCQRGEDHEFDYRAIAADGRIVWLRDVIRIVRDEGGRPVRLRGVMIDITAKKLAEEQIQEMETQLAHVSRLSTMGEMVAGIAHEINQPLAAISNFAAACSKAFEKLDCESELPIENWLQQIEKEAIRCGEIIRRLRTFVNKGDREWEWIDLNNIIRDSIALIGSDIRYRSLTINCCLPDQGPRIFGSRVQLQQVLVNLLRNSCDATSGSPTPQIRVVLKVHDQRARVTVEDNGEGIAEEQRGHLFDPFFTTKPDGMGIGLAISKSIIEAHQGSLRLDSTTTVGARFSIELPLGDPVQDAAQ